MGTGADEKPGKSEEDVKAWDAEFVKVDQGTLFELILVRPCALAALVCIVSLSSCMRGPPALACSSCQFSLRNAGANSRSPRAYFLFHRCLPPSHILGLPPFKHFNLK